MKKKKFSLKKLLLTILIIFIVLLLVVLTLTPISIIKAMGGHKTSIVYAPEYYDISATPITLTTEDDLSIASWLVEATEPRGTIIFLSGIDNPSVTAYFPHAKIMQEHGYSSLLIEMRGHNASEGEVSFGMLEHLDVRAGVDYLKADTNHKDTPIIVFGVSMGGASAITSMGQIPEIDGLIGLSAYSSLNDVFVENMSLSVPAWLANMERPFISAYLGIHFGFKNAKVTPINEIQKLNSRPALLMHSAGDSQIDFSNFERLTNSVHNQENVTLYVVEGDYHFIFRSEDFNYPEEDTDYFDAIFSFLENNFG